MPTFFARIRLDLIIIDFLVISIIRLSEYGTACIYVFIYTDSMHFRMGANENEKKGEKNRATTESR